MTGSIFQTITQDVKDFIPVFGWSAIVSFLAWAYRKSVIITIAITKNHERSEKAMDQIDALTSNHVLHMEAGIAELNKKTEEGNEKLSTIATGIAVLVDRGNRV